MKEIGAGTCKEATREKIACNFRRLDGYLYTEEGEPVDTLESELKPTHRAGLKDVQLVDCVPLDSFKTGPALHFPARGSFIFSSTSKALVELSKETADESTDRHTP